MSTLTECTTQHILALMQENIGAEKHLTESWLSKNDKESVIAYLHEATLGVKHAGVYGFVLVAEGDYVKADSLRYCQEE